MNALRRESCGLESTDQQGWLSRLWHALWTDNAPEMRLAPPTAIAGPLCAVLDCTAPGAVPVRAGFDNYTVCPDHVPVTV